MTTLTKTTFLPVALLAAAMTVASTAPAQAGILDDLINCLLGGCDGGGNNGGGNNGGGNGAPVDPTGRIHPVYLVGQSFFPDTIYAQPGDEIKFYNIAYTTQRVRADDWSWQSNYISRNQSWSMIVQPNTELQFRKSGFGTFYGEIKLEDLPDTVDYGDLVDGQGNVIGKDGTVARVAEGLGYTLASVGGVIQDLGGVVGGVGNGLGLTNDYGQGNNDDSGDS